MIDLSVFQASGRVAALLAALAGAATAGATQGHAQAEVLRGRVLLQGEPVSEVPVTLHRVTPGASGAVGTQLTDAGGAFQFRLPPADTSEFAVFFATAEYASVRHFGRPIHPDEPAGDYALEVYDTASALPGAMRTTRRDLVFLPQADGGWEVNEVVRIHNSAARTLVSRGGMPTWSLPLPAGAAAFEVGEGEIAADQLRHMGDRAVLLMPLLPGERELFFRYHLPPGQGRTALALDSPTDSVNLYVQQPAPNLEVTGLRPTDVLTVEGQRFLQFSGAALDAGARVGVEWQGAAPVNPAAAGAGMAALVLALGMAAALRNRRDRPAAGRA